MARLLLLLVMINMQLQPELNERVRLRISSLWINRKKLLV